jgi:hypothetical protein
MPKIESSIAEFIPVADPRFDEVDFSVSFPTVVFIAPTSVLVAAAATAATVVGTVDIDVDASRANVEYDSSVSCSSYYMCGRMSKFEQTFLPTIDPASERLKCSDG